MISPWWGLGVAVPAFAVKMIRGKKLNEDEGTLSRWVDGC